jgi:hypothetical protein
MVRALKDATDPGRTGHNLALATLPGGAFVTVVRCSMADIDGQLGK